MAIKIFRMFFSFSMLFLMLSLYVSCSDVNVSIKEDTIYERPVAEVQRGYVLGPGDIIEATYFFGTQPTEREYILEIGDVIDVEFYYHSEINKRVTIRPDGKISLAREGDIRAAGLTTLELREKLTELYSDTFKDPVVTINLFEFNQALKGFKEAVTSDRGGQSKEILIRPDGYISLYHLEKDINAAGLTLPQLKTIVSVEYRKKFSSVTVSLALETTNSNLVYVSGEVQRPDAYQLIGPTTVTQILSQAGIIWDNAELSSVLVISRSPEGRPIGRLVNLDKVVGEGNIGHDILLKRFDVVYVPKNKITKVNVFVEQYINRIIPTSVRMTFTYRLDD
jgi:polysaccharide export outer membrane protein